MATESRLVISEIEARNLDLGASKEHKQVKERYVTASLKGLCVIQLSLTMSTSDIQ